MTTTLSSLGSYKLHNLNAQRHGCAADNST